MPDGAYYRKQAQLFARLAITTSDAQIAERYTQMALVQLGKADEVEPAPPLQPHRLGQDGSDMDPA